MVALAGQAEAHRVVRCAELHHVEALDRQDRIEVFDALPLLDHDGDHHLVQRLHIGGRAAFAHGAHVAPHADAEPAAGPRRLGAHRGHAGMRVLDRAQVGEQHRLEAGADRAHRLMRPLRLLDLDHAAEVLQLQRAAEIVEVVHVERRIFRGEFDVVVVAGIADQLHQRRPARQEVGADRRLTGREQRAQAIVTHRGFPLTFVRRYRGGTAVEPHPPQGRTRRSLVTWDRARPPATSDGPVVGI